MLLRHFSILTVFSNLVYAGQTFEFFSIKDRIAFLALQRKCYEVSVENTESAKWCEILQKEFNMLEDCQNLDTNWASHSEKQTCKTAERFKKSSQQEKCRSPRNSYQNNRCEMIRRCPVIARSFSKVTDANEKAMIEQTLGVCKAANTKDPVNALKPEESIDLKDKKASMCPVGMVPVWGNPGVRGKGGKFGKFGKGKGKMRQRSRQTRNARRGKGKFGKGKFGKGKFGKGKFGKGKFGNGKGKGAFRCVKDTSDPNAKILEERERKHQQALEHRKLEAKRLEDKIQIKHNKDYRKAIKEAKKEQVMEDRMAERIRAEKEKELDREARERKHENDKAVAEHQRMLDGIEMKRQAEARIAEQEAQKKQDEINRKLDIIKKIEKREQAQKDREEAKIRAQEAKVQKERERLEAELATEKQREEKLVKDEEMRIKKEQEEAESKRLQELREYQTSLKEHKKALSDYAREQAEFEAQENQRIADEKAALAGAVRAQAETEREEAQKYQDLIRKRELENEKALNAPKTQLPPDAVENVESNVQPVVARNPSNVNRPTGNGKFRGKGKGKFRGKGKGKFRGKGKGKFRGKGKGKFRGKGKGKFRHRQRPNRNLN